MSHHARSPRTRLTGCCAFLLLAAAPLFAADYVPDPGYNNGQMSADNFAGGYDYRRGQKLVHLDNGDIIVAGVVPGVGDAAGHDKIGLVRYNSAGVRQTWSNPGSNGVYSNQYVISPCITESTSLCGDVTDVQGIYLYGSQIFVLANDDHVFLRTTPPYGASLAPGVNVYVFGTDGSLQHMTTIDGADGATGGGIAVYGSNSISSPGTSLVYVGNTVVNNVWSPRFARYIVASDGTMTAAVEAMDPGLSICDSSGCGSSSTQFNGIALGGSTVSTVGTPNIYITGSSWDPGNDTPGSINWPAHWYAFAAKVSSSGVASTSFGYDGTVSFEIGKQNGGQKIAVKRPVITGSDEIFVMSDVEQSCKNGIAIVKVDHTGARVQAFGNHGVLQYGGSDQSNVLNCNQGWSLGSIRADYPKDIAYANGKLGVAGFNVYRTLPLCSSCEDSVDGELAVIDSTSGAIESWRGYAFSETPGGARSRHSGFWGVTANGDDTFSVAGDVRYFNSAPADRAGKNMYATLRLAPLSDVIFKNGFD